MKKAKALKDFIAISDTAFENKLLTVYSGLNGNVYSPYPVPAIQELNTGIQQYSAARALSKNRDRVKIEEKNVLRKHLEGILISLMDYVNYVANGNRTMLLTSGFTVTAETSNTAFFSGAINNLNVKQGNNSGEIVVSFKRVTGRRVYVFCYAEATATDDYWKIEFDILPGIVIKGLQRGKEYIVRVGVIGAQGQVIYSAIVSTVVS